MERREHIAPSYPSTPVEIELPNKRPIEPFGLPDSIGIEILKLCGVLVRDGSGW
jgi:hypothetical protein